MGGLDGKQVVFAPLPPNLAKATTPTPQNSESVNQFAA
jgi:hypothetical protein